MANETAVVVNASLMRNENFTFSPWLIDNSRHCRLRPGQASAMTHGEADSTHHEIALASL
jgi:hypothetical protein